MTTTARVEVWSNWRCASGARQAIIPLADCLTLRTTERLSREDECTLVVPSSAPAVDALVPSAVLAIVYEDGEFDEYRIARVADGSGRAGDRVTVLARGPLFDLRDGVGAYFHTTTNAVTTLGITYTLTSPATIIDTLLASLPSWWDRGTVDTAAPVTVSGGTALEILRAVVTALALQGIAVELDIRRNGSSGYFIDLVDAIGGDATIPDIRTGKNLIELQRVVEREDQAARVQPTCAGGELIAGARWRVDSVSGTDVVLKAPETGELPLRADDQLNGWYVQTDDNPPAYRAINDSVLSTGVLTLAAATGIAVGELVRIVASSAQAGVATLANAAVTGGAARTAVLDTGLQATTNYAKNPWFESWPGAAAPGVGVLTLTGFEPTVTATRSGSSG